MHLIGFTDSDICPQCTLNTTNNYFAHQPKTSGISQLLSSPKFWVTVFHFPFLSASWKYRHKIMCKGSLFFPACFFSPPTRRDSYLHVAPSAPLTSPSLVSVSPSPSPACLSLPSLPAASPPVSGCPSCRCFLPPSPSSGPPL